MSVQFSGNIELEKQKINGCRRQTRVADDVVGFNRRGAERLGKDGALLVSCAVSGLRDGLIPGAFSDDVLQVESRLHHRRECIENIGGFRHQCGAVLDQPVGAMATRIEWRARHRKNEPAKIASQPCS